MTYIGSKEIFQQLIILVALYESKDSSISSDLVKKNCHITSYFRLANLQLTMLH